MSHETDLDKSYIERNRQQRERLKVLVNRLSDDELAQPVGEHWTIAATLAHMAYWDIRGVGALEATLRHDLPLIFWDGSDGLPVNQVMTPKWLDIPPREAAQRALAAAEVIDRLIERLPDEMIAAVARERYRILERAIHWSEHLDDIEHALGDRK